MSADTELVAFLLGVFVYKFVDLLAAHKKLSQSVIRSRRLLSIGERESISYVALLNFRRRCSSNASRSQIKGFLVDHLRFAWVDRMFLLLFMGMTLLLFVGLMLAMMRLQGPTSASHNHVIIGSATIFLSFVVALTAWSIERFRLDIERI